MALPYLLMGEIDEAGTYLRKGRRSLRAARDRARARARRRGRHRGAHRQPGRRGDPRLRPAADRHRFARDPARHPRHRSSRRARVLDDGRRAPHRRAGGAGLARAAGRRRLHRLHHHGSAGEPRRAADRGRDGRSHGAADDDAGGGQHDPPLVRGQGRARPRQGARRPTSGAPPATALVATLDAARRSRRTSSSSPPACGPNIDFLRGSGIACGTGRHRRRARCAPACRTSTRPATWRRAIDPSTGKRASTRSSRRRSSRRASRR